MLNHALLIEPEFGRRYLAPLVEERVAEQRRAQLEQLKSVRSPFSAYSYLFLKNTIMIVMVSIIIAFLFFSATLILFQWGVLSAIADRATRSTSESTHDVSH